MGVERAGAALIRRHSALQIIHLLYNLISSVAFLPPPSPCRGASPPAPQAPSPIKGARDTPWPPLVAEMLHSPRARLSLPRGSGGSACLGSPPAASVPPESCSPPPSRSQLGCARGAAKKPPLSPTAGSPPPARCPGQMAPAPPASPSAPSPEPGNAAGWGSSAPHPAACTSAARAQPRLHTGQSEGAPLHPVSPSDSLPAPGKAQRRPRLDISLQALQLCSFPWQQQTHNYRYIILYKTRVGSRARVQGSPAHSLFPC